MMLIISIDRYSATFIGYLLSGIWGAIVTTFGIFLPSFLLVLIINPLIDKLRKTEILRRFLDGVNIGAIGVMLTVAIQLGTRVLYDWKTRTIILVCLILLQIQKNQYSLADNLKCSRRVYLKINN